VHRIPPESDQKSDFRRGAEVVRAAHTARKVYAMTHLSWRASRAGPSYRGSGLRLSVVRYFSSHAEGGVDVGEAKAAGPSDVPGLLGAPFLGAAPVARHASPGMTRVGS